MKKIVVKVKEQCFNSEKSMRKLLNDIQEYSIPGTLNLRRITMRQVQFRIDDISLRKINNPEFEEKTLKILDC